MLVRVLVWKSQLCYGFGEFTLYIFAKTPNSSKAWYV